MAFQHYSISMQVYCNGVTKTFIRIADLGGLGGAWAYLHVVGSWDVGCSFEGVRHIS